MRSRKLAARTICDCSGRRLTTMMQRRVDWYLLCYFCEGAMEPRATHYFGYHPKAGDHVRMCMACWKAEHPPEVQTSSSGPKIKKPARPKRCWQAYGMSWSAFREHQLALTGVQIQTREGLFLIGDTDDVGNRGGLIIPEGEEILRYRKILSARNGLNP